VLICLHRGGSPIGAAAPQIIFSTRKKFKKNKKLGIELMKYSGFKEKFI